MKRKLYALVIAGLLALPACKDKQETSEPKEAAADKQEEKQEELDPLAQAKKNAEALGALPEQFESKDNPITTAKVDLGRKLYYDTRLSKADDVSCNSCHALDNFGVDNKPVSEGHKKQTGDRNSPTVYNAANQVAQFWDGRAADVEEQATGPVVNPVEMAMTDGKEVAAKVKKIEGYADLFEKAFPEEEEPVTLTNIGKAIGAFERKLVTPSRFDKFVEGDDKALTEQEIRGLNTFVEVGCTSCHMGDQVGGTMYQKLGLIKEWPDKSDLGRFKVTKEESDKMMFKVPILRNVEKTAPYFHDGSVETLEEAVKLMATHQRGMELTDEQVDDIVAFLKSLTGEIPKDYIQKPELPGMKQATKGEEPT
jgi:cytochrome c peroxidase